MQAASPTVALAPVVPVAPVAPLAATALSEHVWALLAQVHDPEIPVLSLADLGVLRAVHERSDGADGTVEVVITPTYSGCPAIEQMEQDIVGLLAQHGIRASVRRQLAPAWSSDDLSAAGRAKLRAYGIAPPQARAPANVQPPSTGGAGAAPQVLRFQPRPQALEDQDAPVCPRCASERVQQNAFFGSTACKAQYRCLACLEPFDYFKPY